MPRIAALLCALVAAGHASCLPPLMVKAETKQADPELEARKRNVRFIRAKKRALEPKPVIDPKAWPYDPAPPALPERIGCLRKPLGVPLKRIRLSSTYRDPNHAYDLFKGYHTGIDLPAPVGTPVLAPAGGTVKKADDERIEDAWSVTVDMGDGWRFRAVHLSEVRVAVGDEVRAGDVIGLSGAEPDDYGSGPFTTGPHLHFDLAYGGAFVDPRPHFCSKPLKSP